MCTRLQTCTTHTHTWTIQTKCLQRLSNSFPITLSPAILPQAHLHPSHVPEDRHHIPPRTITTKIMHTRWASILAYFIFIVFQPSLSLSIRQSCLATLALSPCPIETQALHSRRSNCILSYPTPQTTIAHSHENITTKLIFPWNRVL